MPPAINLLARPNINWEAIESFLNENKTKWTQSDTATIPEEVVEFAGRICYMSFGKNQSPRTNLEYIKNLIDQGHESVLEHACWTFEISNITRSFSHQLVRHRIGFSYSQLSQQYADHTDFGMTPAIDLTHYPNAKKAWAEAEQLTRKAYSKFKKAIETDMNELGFVTGKEKEKFINTIARQILPNSTKTTIIVSANARALRHFLKIRGNTIWDPEMRAVCVRLLEILQNEAPALFYDFKIVSTPDNTEAVVCSE